MKANSNCVVNNIPSAESAPNRFFLTEPNGVAGFPAEIRPPKTTTKKCKFTKLPVVCYHITFVHVSIKSSAPERVVCVAQYCKT